MPLNKADARAQLMDPKLRAAGWSDSLIARDHFYRRDSRYAAGRINLVGCGNLPDGPRAAKSRSVVYALWLNNMTPLGHETA